nr:PREDICTED: adenylate kinase 8 isoform X1 [Lepisosteus oculatus]XP_015222603.1 PREDICTED: adenylate kinase 8 isoform X1 [Lepisosteus oculatus]
MDATTKPLRIPPEMGIYAEKHEIFDLLQSMLTRLLVDEPEDPIQFLIDLLKRDGLQVPRVFLLGPPASGKRTIAKMLCEHTHATQINASSLLKEESDLVKRALQYQEKQQEIPSELWIKLVQQRLSKMDCIKRGWVFEGLPRTREQALLLQEAGIAPEHVVFLDAPDTVLIERNLGKRIDPFTGDVYHATFSWPSDDVVARRLQEAPGISEEETAAQLLQFHRESHAVQRTYQQQLRVINADQPSADVFSQTLTFALSRPRSAAPHTPRVVLLGSPGSGKSLQAAIIAQKYNVVNICCGQVLKSAVADETSLGELIKTYLESGQQVPDSVVVKILTERLSRLDCTTRGWILHGFPRDLEQAEKLHEAGFVPNRVFFLEIPNDVAIERITLRAVDPVTGERYHSVYKAPPGPPVQSRLQWNPRDSEEGLLQSLAECRAHAPDLQDFYPHTVHINADQDPHAVFESLESRLVNRLPRYLPASALPEPPH